MAAELKCGNGICESIYGETTSNCAADCVTAQGPTPGTGGGGGGGGGGGISRATLQEELEKLNISEKIDEALKAVKKLGGVEIATTSIYKELFPGEDTNARIRAIEVLKMRGTNNSKKIHPMEIDDQGIKIHLNKALFRRLK